MSKYEAEKPGEIITSHEARMRLHATLLEHCRDTEARALALYEALPWYQRVFKRRPTRSFTGGYKVKLVQPLTPIVLGIDRHRRDDATAVIATEADRLRALVYYAWQELVRHGETPLTHDLLKATQMTGRQRDDAGETPANVDPSATMP